MNDWFRPVPLFEGENEAELKTAFAKLWARYPTQLPGDIGRQVFALLREPLRGLQAGAVWSRELDVLELRDRFAREGTLELITIEQTRSEVLQAARVAIDDKDKASLYKLYAEISGFIVKPDKNINLKMPDKPTRIEFVAVEPKLFEDDNLPS